MTEGSVEATAVKTSVDEVLAQELVERAWSEGVELVGPGGLLTGLTKSALEAEMDEHLGIRSTLRRAATG